MPWAVLMLADWRPAVAAPPVVRGSLLSPALISPAANNPSLPASPETGDRRLFVCGAPSGVEFHRTSWRRPELATAAGSGYVSRRVVS